MRERERGCDAVDGLKMCAIGELNSEAVTDKE